MTLAEIFNYIFGSTTLVSIYVAWHSRKAQIKTAEATALTSMQVVYDNFVIHTEKELQKLRQTIEKQDIKIKELEKYIKNNSQSFRKASITDE